MPAVTWSLSLSSTRNRLLCPLRDCALGHKWGVWAPQGFSAVPSSLDFIHNCLILIPNRYQWLNQADRLSN